MTRFAVNALQVFDQPDGTLDFSAGPGWDATARLVADAGFDALHTDLLDSVSERDYLDRLRELGLEPSPGYVSCRLDDTDATTAALDRARMLARQHAALGLSEVFVADDLNPQRLDRPAVGWARDADRFAVVLGNLSRLVAVIRDEGVAPCLHPHVGSWIETEPEVRDALDSLAPALAFGPDIGHLSWAGANVTLLLSDYASVTGALHIKDMRTAVRDQALADRVDYTETVRRGLWTEPGHGDLPIADYLAALGPDFPGWAVVEVDHTELSAHESLVLSAQWTERN